MYYGLSRYKIVYTNCPFDSHHCASGLILWLPSFTGMKSMILRHTIKSIAQHCIDKWHWNTNPDIVRNWALCMVLNMAGDLPIELPDTLERVMAAADNSHFEASQPVLMAGSATYIHAVSCFPSYSMNFKVFLIKWREEWTLTLMIRKNMWEALCVPYKYNEWYLPSLLVTKTKASQQRICRKKQWTLAIKDEML